MIEYYAVIDTNVLVSALLKKNSVPRTIIDLIDDEVIIPVSNDEILKEYKAVLSRQKFHFDTELIYEVINLFEQKGVTFKGIATEETLPDPKDVVFYEVTLDAREDYNTRLVTGNKKHFPDKGYVVTPREMLDIILKENIGK